MCVISGILKLKQLGQGLMGKVKQHNLRRHTVSLKPFKMVKKMTPDKKSRLVDGLKEKLIKKRPKPAKKVVKKKARWTSDAPVICKWCKKVFSR